MLVKEELVKYLMGGHIHVSRQDYLFFSNLSKIADNKKVTTGQDKLLNKLVDKYQRQLKNQNLDISFLKNLEWNHDLIQTRIEYLRAELSLTNNELVLRSPFNKAFNQALRKYGGSNTFIWDKVLRVHKSPASTYALQLIVNLIEKHFPEYVYCDNIKSLLEDIKGFKGLVWNPTLVKSNENFYIAACNSVLFDQLKDLNLSKDAKTFFQLSKYGVKISDDLIDNEELKFASNFQYEIDISQINELCRYVKNLGFDEINIGRHLYTRTIYADIRDKMLDEGIKIVGYNELNSIENKDYILAQFRNMYTQNVDTKKASKVVFIKNSNPVKVK